MTQSAFGLLEERRDSGIYFWRMRKKSTTWGPILHTVNNTLKPNNRNVTLCKSHDTV